MLPAHTHNGTDHPLSVLVVHNRYQRRGGEDGVVQAEVDLLRATGVHVEVLLADSRDDASIQRLATRPDQLVFNRDVYRRVRGIIRQRRIQVVHCHNLFPLLSTSVYAAAQVEGVPIIQTVHNYRIACLNGLHLRNGKICERCSPGQHLPGIRQACYRGSFRQSAMFGLAQTINAWRGVWQQPTVYIAPSELLRTKLIEWGIPHEKIVLKPHFVPNDPGKRGATGWYALFVGRLSPEKGLDLLLDVWTHERLPLVVVGDGPLRTHLEARVRNEGRTNVCLVGQQDQDGVHGFLRHAQFLVIPSLWLEAFGLVVIEAYAHGVPVVASRLGALADIVEDGVTGMLFTSNHHADLAAKLSAIEADPARVAAMSRAARQTYERLYSAQANAGHMRAVYTHAIAQRNAGQSS